MDIFQRLPTADSSLPVVQENTKEQKMSHVAMIEAQILDLNCLKQACQDLGLEFKIDQKTYHWFGQSVGDYPLPQGFTAKELGHCLHAIGIPNNKKAYELGIVARRDGKPGFALLWDFWAGGYGLQEVVGNNCNKLMQAYQANVAMKSLKKKGYQVRKEVNPQTKVVRVIGRKG